MPPPTALRATPTQGAQAMTRDESRLREARAKLLTVRERYEDVMSGLDAERARLLARGSFIPSPVWRQLAASSLRPYGP
jgi:hypothetical protein